MADAFISYARENQDFARRLHGALVEAGHSVWVDWESIHPGSDWLTEIAEGIDQSDAVIYVVTRTSVRSKECLAELEHATGLTVQAALDTDPYPKGIKITDAQMTTLTITRHDFHGDWNYTIQPRTYKDINP